MRQIICETIRLLWLHLLLLTPFARIHCARIKTTNQNQKKWLQTAPLPGTCAHSVKLSIFSEWTQWQTTAYMTKTSKQNKTNEEKQAKKKELDRAMLRGGALEAGLECSRERGGGTCKSTLVSVLPTSALNACLH